MSSGPQLFKIDPSEKNAEAVAEVEFPRAGFQERRDIQEWVAANPNVLGEELLIIAKEFSGFDKTSERPDLVAVDKDGNLVIIELKRDDSGADVHWQAIKYASYFQGARPEAIVKMLAAYAKIPEEEAADRLRQHLDADDLETLNKAQRIILASHRFAPEVTSAVLWLNEKVPSKDLITCVQLTPYEASESGSLFIQTSTILPVPGIKDLVVTIGSFQTGKGGSWAGGRVRDEVSRFFRGAASLAVNALEDELKPDRKSRRAGVGPRNRYYQLWYSWPPWGNQSLRYQLLLPKVTQSAPFEVSVRLSCNKRDQVRRHRENEEWFSQQALTDFSKRLADLEVAQGGKITFEDDSWLAFDDKRTGEALDSAFRDSVANKLRGFIERVTPVVNGIIDERNEERDKPE